MQRTALLSVTDDDCISTTMASDLEPRSASVSTNTTVLNPLIQTLDRLDILRLSGGLGCAESAMPLTTIVSTIHDPELQYELVLDYLRIGLDVNCQDENGKTALMHACYLGYERTVEALLNADGINLTAVDYDGNSALMISCLTGRHEIVRMLLDKADELLTCPAQLVRFLQCKNNTEDTAELMAVGNGHSQCYLLLREYTDKLHKNALLSVHDQDSLELINITDYDSCPSTKDRETITETGTSFWRKFSGRTSSAEKSLNTTASTRRAVSSNATKRNRYLLSEEYLSTTSEALNPMDSLQSDGSPNSASLASSARHSLNNSDTELNADDALLTSQLTINKDLDFWRKQKPPSRKLKTEKKSDKRPSRHKTRTQRRQTAAVVKNDSNNNSSNGTYVAGPPPQYCATGYAVPTTNISNISINVDLEFSTAQHRSDFSAYSHQQTQQHETAPQSWNDASILLENPTAGVVVPRMPSGSTSYKRTLTQRLKNVFSTNPTAADLAVSPSLRSSNDHFAAAQTQRTLIDLTLSTKALMFPLGMSPVVMRKPLASTCIEDSGYQTSSGSNMMILTPMGRSIPPTTTNYRLQKYDNEEFKLPPINPKAVQNCRNLFAKRLN